MSQTTKKISLLIPAYNEERSLQRLFAALDELMDGPLSQRYTFEVMLVNDGSTDATLRMLREQRQRDQRYSYVSLSRNFGKEAAMLAGLDYVSGDATIILDADLQDPLGVVPEMVQWWEQGYEDVYGRRASRGRESLMRKHLSLAFYRFLQSSTRFDVLPNVGDFRLLDRRCVDALRQLRETQRYTKGLFCWIGFRKKEVVFNRDDRVAGQSSFNFRGLFNLALEGITSFTTAPLRLASVMGIVIAIVAFIYLLVIFTKTLIWGDPVQGFPALMCVILFLGGIQLLCIGIIGEYVGRIFNESKNRPVYLVEDVNGNRI